MDAERIIELVSRNTEEVLLKDDLAKLIEQGRKLKHYIGFEISGKVHLGTGLMTGAKIADFQKAKIDCSCYLATWHAWINNKLGGDIDTIRKIGAGYFKEGLRAGIMVMGGDVDKVKFVTGDELYHNNDEYWQTVIEISKNMTLKRAMRAITIMGRKEGESVNFAHLVYPAMQVADIFIQDINIAHAGMDQRKAHVIAREVSTKLKIRPLLDKDKKPYKPVAVHHHLILGLQKPPVWPVPQDKLRELWSSMKMSKSVPNSAVFIHDSEEDIKKKMSKAFCPEKVTDFNPVLDWANNLLFRDEKYNMTIERPDKFGGEVTFHNFDELEVAFREGKLHPMDLKIGVANGLIKLLEPARKHFTKPKIRKMKEELEALTITR
jgi:tyrosyl-tRNA synthetase